LIHRIGTKLLSLAHSKGEASGSEIKLAALRGKAPEALHPQLCIAILPVTQR
jgi:hypothetical protein